MNFLHITTFYPPFSFGGDAIYVQRLAHALGDRGHHVDVVHCLDSHNLAGRAQGAGSGSHPNVTVHPLHSPLGPLSPLLSHQTGLPLLKQHAIEKLLQCRRYDVIHFHNISLFGPGVLAPSDPAAINLYTTHEYWLVCPTHMLWKFGRELCREPDCLQCTLRANRPPQLWRYTGLLDRAIRSVDQFLAPSRFTARLHAERGFAASIRYLPNFCDRTDEDWLRPQLRRHPAPYFLYVGRLETVKGLHTVVEQWRQVQGFDLLVAGSGSQDSSLRALASSDPRIRFLGHVAPADLGNLYTHAAGLIVPSLAYEIFSLAVIEAHARKTPVIARRIGGLAELVDESGGGLLYESDGELIAAINLLGSNPTLRMELGERGYSHFVARCSREAHLDQYMDVLRETAQRKLGRVPWEETPVIR